MPASTTVEMIVPDGFDERDVLGVWSTLRTACSIGAPLEIRLVHPTGRATSTGRLGLSVPTDGLPGTAPAVLVVPGPVGGSQQAELLDVVVRAHARGSVVVGSGAGAVCVAAAGLLTGRPATTRWDLPEQLARHGAVPVGARVVDQGDVITSDGASVGLDVALHLVRRFAGEEVAYLTGCGVEHER